MTQDASALVMERSCNEFRTKKEEVDILDNSLPPSVKFGVRSWEMSLRNGTPDNNAVIFCI